MNAPTAPKPDNGPAKADKPAEPEGPKPEAKRNEPKDRPNNGPNNGPKKEDPPKAGPNKDGPKNNPQGKDGPKPGPNKDGAQGTALTVTKDAPPPQAKQPPKPPVKQPPKPQPKPQPAAAKIPPPAKPGSFKRRHLFILISFVLTVVVLPSIVAWYLWARAADQYASTVAFSVRTEENASSITSLLGPLNLSGSSTSDTDILYEFVQSQDLVSRIDAKLDLRTLWSKANPDIDPVFSYHPPGTIEDLVDHWGRMVSIYYDSGTGLMELRVLAFAPEDAQAIAEEIYAESTAMVNELSHVAREDAIGYARDELEHAVERLKAAREAMTKFRNRTQIVDPTVDLQGQAGLLNILNQQLAAALIEADLLKQTTRENDPRIAQAERRIGVIETRIDEEKQKLGSGGSDAFATLLGEYERLAVDREFAERTYTAALANFDASQAEARRQNRYLAAHVRPTLAEKSKYPERLTLLGLIALFLFLIWTVLVLVIYSLRDRR